MPKNYEVNMENRVKMDSESNVNKDKEELKEAKTRIEQLEKKIAILEGRIPEKYPDVKYLGYKERKRILVIMHILISLTLER